MFTEDKITEIFCIADDFCNFFDAQMKKKIPETGWLILFRGVAYTLNPRVVSTAVTVVRIRLIHTDHLFFVLSVIVSSFHFNYRVAS